MLRLSAFPLQTRDSRQDCAILKRKHFSYIPLQNPLLHHSAPTTSTRLVVGEKLACSYSINSIGDVRASRTVVLSMKAAAAAALGPHADEIRMTSLATESCHAFYNEKDAALITLSSVIPVVAVGRTSFIELMPYFPCDLESPSPVSLVDLCQEALSDSSTYGLWSEWRITFVPKFKHASIETNLDSCCCEIVPCSTQHVSARCACDKDTPIYQGFQLTTEANELQNQYDYLVDDNIVLEDLIPFHQSVYFWHSHVTSLVYNRGTQIFSRLDLSSEVKWMRQYTQCSEEGFPVTVGAMIPRASGLPEAVRINLCEYDCSLDSSIVWQNDGILEEEIFLINCETLCLSFSRDQSIKSSGSSLVRTSDNYIGLAHSLSKVGITNTRCLMGKFTDEGKLKQERTDNDPMLYRVFTQLFPLLPYDACQRRHCIFTFPLSFLSLAPVSAISWQKSSVRPFPLISVDGLAPCAWECIPNAGNGVDMKVLFPRLSTLQSIVSVLTLFGWSESLYDSAMDTLTELEASLGSPRVECCEVPQQLVRSQVSIVSEESEPHSHPEAQEMDSDVVDDMDRDSAIRPAEQPIRTVPAMTTSMQVSGILDNLQSLDIDHVLNWHIGHDLDHVSDQPALISDEPVAVSKSSQEHCYDHMVYPQVANIKPQRKSMSLCEGVCILLAEDLLEIMPNLCAHLQENYKISCIDVPILYADIMLSASNGLVIFDPTSLLDFQTYQTRLRYMAQLALKCTNIYVIFAFDHTLHSDEIDLKYLELCRSTMRFPHNVVIRTCEYEIQSLSACIAFALQHTLLESLRVPTWTKERLSWRPYLDPLTQGNNTSSCMMLQLFPTINFYLAAQLITTFPVQSLCTISDVDVLRQWIVKWNSQYEELAQNVQDFLKLLHAHIGLVA